MGFKILTLDGRCDVRAFCGLVRIGGV